VTAEEVDIENLGETLDGRAVTMADMRTIAIKMYGSKPEMERMKRHPLYPHSHPGSVYVAQIGRRYAPGAWQALVNMVLYTQGQGYECLFNEIPPSFGGKPPWADIGNMRDLARLNGITAGCEFICMIDGDCIPKPDLLVRLLERNVAMVGPYIIEPALNTSLGYPPNIQPNQGLVPMRWIGGTMMLFRTSVFNCPGIHFSGIVCDHVFFQQFWTFGHHPYMDTDVKLHVTAGPERASGQTWDERQEWLKMLYDEQDDRPDRRPLNPDSRAAVDGVYAPWVHMIKSGGQKMYIEGVEIEEAEKEAKTDEA